MQVLTRHAQRILAGQEDNSPELVWSPGWVLTVNPGGPQAGSVGYHGNRFTHRIQEAITDGGVYTRDRQLYEALVGLGVYSTAVAPSAYNYARGILLDQPVAYWRLGEAVGATTAVDHMGVLNGAYIGSQVPNIHPDPSFELDTVGSAPNASYWFAFANAGMTLNTGLISSTWANRGVNSAHIRATHDATTNLSRAGVATASGTAHMIPILGSTTYTIQATWNVIAATTKGPSFEFLWYDSSGTLISSISTISGSLAPNLTGIFSGSFTPPASPANAAYLRVQVDAFSNVAGEVSEFYVDTVSVTKSSSAPVYSDTQGVTLGQASALSGDIDTAVALDGASGYVEMGVNSPNSLRPTNAVSCEALFRSSSANTSRSGLVSSFGGGSLGYILRLVGSSVDMWVGGTNVSTPLSYTDNVWHHAVGTWDGATISVYVDGQLKASTAFAGPLAYSPASNRTQVGSYNSSAGIANPLLGGVDEVAVYNYALSATQVSNHYASLTS